MARTRRLPAVLLVPLALVAVVVAADVTARARPAGVPETTAGAGALLQSLEREMALAPAKRMAVEQGSSLVAAVLAAAVGMAAAGAGWRPAWPGVVTLPATLTLAVRPRGPPGASCC